ncbi:rCG28915, partial [Rattus norvegicus]
MSRCCVTLKRDGQILLTPEHRKFPGVAGHPAVVILGPAQCKHRKGSSLIRGINKGSITSCRA